MRIGGVSVGLFSEETVDVCQPAQAGSGYGQSSCNVAYPLMEVRRYAGRDAATCDDENSVRCSIGKGREALVLFTEGEFRPWRYESVLLVGPLIGDGETFPN